MTTQKVSVTLEAAAIERARAVAGPRGLSSYLDTALQEKLERDEVRRLFLEHLDELEGSDPTPHEVRQRAGKRANKLRRSVSG